MILLSNFVVLKLGNVFKVYITKKLFGKKKSLKNSFTSYSKWFLIILKFVVKRMCTVSGYTFFSIKSKSYCLDFSTLKTSVFLIFCLFLIFLFNIRIFLCYVYECVLLLYYLSRTRKFNSLVELSKFMGLLNHYL